MKNLKLAFLVSLFVIGCANGQVDTTDWFPMQTGNYWEYMAWDSPPKYFSIKVLGDTLMDNGKIYKIFSEEYFDPYSQDEWYLRNNSDLVLRYFPDTNQCHEFEYVYLDFSLPDSSIWNIYRLANGNARGIRETFYDYTYYSFLNKPNMAKLFEDVEMTANDTIWTPFLSPGPIVINRGLGMVWRFRFSDGSYYLQGAILNGVRMGTITKVENENEYVPISSNLSQNYPNPFNPSTSIQYAISSRQFVTLKVFDVLGKEVATLVNEEKSAGSYEIEFNSVESLHSTSLPSGVYFYQLKAGEYIETKKMILMK